MTAFTPAITLYVNNVAYTNWVDHQISITRGYSDIDSTAQPSVATITLIGVSDVAFGAEVNDIIRLDDAAVGIFYKGRLTDITITTEAFGVLGNITTATLTVMGATYDLLNTTWYLNSDTTTTGDALINLIMEQAGQTQWSEVNPTLTWNAVEPTIIWGNYSDVNSTTIFGYTTGGTWPSMKLTAGQRDVWSDLNAIVASARGFIQENDSGSIIFWGRLTSGTTGDTLPANVIDPALAVSKSLNDIRNKIEIANLSGTTPIVYADDYSVYLYGEMAGSQSTLLTNTLDVDTLGTILLDARAYPKGMVKALTVDAVNENMTGAVRSALINGEKTWPYYLWTTSGVPLVYGGDVDRVIIGETMNISKYHWTITLNTLDASSYYSHKNWAQINKMYTWTSYGTAFPTTKWSDL
jgi:hypothetical protein